ncbi:MULTISPECIES: DUF2304 domain-containing protein [Paenibacillus]|uniref:DUF2304 domain-containing protein n=1 Tax=Paenibacillus lignilyticus TaxID=1172615 RepID=A0ABS5CIN2_9BACL|nr:MULTISPECIES: DUF2304 domain-containing protein [Paenibacillus]MBP3965735.1 DUF2304 domain-containing protein [Paenibacillus lignilyticus]SFS48177.1 hypothetical protein SAMN05428962_0313 [Paenibacillus sp. BC26]
MNQLVAILITLFFLGLIVSFTVTHKLKDRYAFLWLITAIAGVLAAACIPLLNRFALWIGIAYMPTFVFLVTIIFILALLVRQTMSLSNQSEKMKTLTQEFAVMEKKLLDLQKAVEGRETL